MARSSSSSQSQDAERRPDPMRNMAACISPVGIHLAARDAVSVTSPQLVERPVRLWMLKSSPSCSRSCASARIATSILRERCQPNATVRYSSSRYLRPAGYPPVRTVAKSRPSLWTPETASGWRPSFGVSGIRVSRGGVVSPVNRMADGLRRGFGPVPSPNISSAGISSSTAGTVRRRHSASPIAFVLLRPSSPSLLLNSSNAASRIAAAWSFPSLMKISAAVVRSCRRHRRTVSHTYATPHA